MKAIFNSRITSLEKISLNPKNRAFCYGDGLFETFVTGAKRINLVGLHSERLKRGCEVLNLDFQDLNENKINQMIEDLALENNISGEIRSRLRLWRKPAGLYAPTSSGSEFLLEVAPNLTPALVMASGIDISETAKVHHSAISFAKTMSSIQYVMAGIEMKKLQLDDIILLNSSGYLAETHSSNLFWIKDDIIFTPALSTGCIAGVMREFFMSQFTVKEVLASPSVLNFADSIFSTNASGIKYFTHYNAKTYGSPENKLAKFLKQLQQP
jgi:branched-subunit amino acid aminotransferase/4-amino-4-deoxychorismate lyase